MLTVTVLAAPPALLFRVKPLILTVAALTVKFGLEPLLFIVVVAAPAPCKVVLPPLAVRATLLYSPAKS